MKKKNILFVCKANVGRSVIAEYALKKFLKEKGVKGINVASAGLENITQTKTPPPVVIKSASYLGMDVKPHRARLLSKELVKKSDGIYVFEKNHKDYIEAKFPDSKGKVKVLREIRDLKGMHFETHIKYFKEIEDAVGEISEIW